MRSPMVFVSSLCAWSKRGWFGVWVVVGAAEGRPHSWWMLRLASLGRCDTVVNKQLVGPFRGGSYGHHPTPHRALVEGMQALFILSSKLFCLYIYIYPCFVVKFDALKAIIHFPINNTNIVNDHICKSLRESKTPEVGVDPTLRLTHS